MFCTKCGSLLDEGARFCGNCGTPVEAQEVPKAEKPDGESDGFHKTSDATHPGKSDVPENEYTVWESGMRETGEISPTGSRKRNQNSSYGQRKGTSGQKNGGRKKKDLWEEESYDEEYEQQAKKEKAVFIALSVVIVILVAAIVAGIVLLVGGEQENRQAPQLNEQLRKELEKDDQKKTEEITEDMEEEVTPEITSQPEEDAETDSNRQVTPNPTVQAQNTPTPTALLTPTPEVVEEVSDDYILPYSSSQYITEADLAGLSEWEIRVARNEIYARHGRIFTSSDLAEYFSQKSWYIPTIPADQFDNSYLNSIEIANLQVITQYEADHNLNQ